MRWKRFKGSPGKKWIGVAAILALIAVDWWQHEVGVQRGIEVIGSSGSTPDSERFSAAIDHAL